MGFTPDDLPGLNVCRVYGASDHAVRIKQRNDCTCMGVGRFSKGILYLDPDLVWDKIDTRVAVDKMLHYAREFHPLYWWAEKENISGSIGPFLKDRMMDESSFMSITEIAHKNKDLMARAQPAQAMVNMGLIRFPKYAPWWQRAEKEMLVFPNGAHDDFVSFLAHLCRGINLMISPNQKKVEPTFVEQTGFNITPRTLKEQVKKDKRAERLLMADR